jgi:hypothetical protein
MDHFAHVPQDHGDHPGEAALSARLVADQLGHSRTSTTQDYDPVRRSVDSQAALALEAALRDAWPENQTVAKPWGTTKARPRDGTWPAILYAIRDSNPEPADSRNALLGDPWLCPNLRADLRIRLGSVLASTGHFRRLRFHLCVVICDVRTSLDPRERAASDFGSPCAFDR